MCELVCDMCAQQNLRIYIHVYKCDHTRTNATHANHHHHINWIIFRTNASQKFNNNNSTKKIAFSYSLILGWDSRVPIIFWMVSLKLIHSICNFIRMKWERSTSYGLIIDGNSQFNRNIVNIVLSLFGLLCLHSGNCQRQIESEPSVALMLCYGMRYYMLP